MTDVDNAPQRTPWFSRRIKLSLAGAVGAVALGIGAVVALPALTAGPAYAVEQKDNGEVEVNVFSPQEAQELEQTLADYGVKAKVDFPPDGYRCNPDRYESTAFPPSDNGVALVFNRDTRAGARIGFTVDPDDFPMDGDVTLVVDISEKYFEPAEDLSRIWSTGLAAAKGEVGECDPIETDGSGQDKADSGSKNKD